MTRHRGIHRRPLYPPVPAAWHDVGGALDLVTRVARGNVYRPARRRALRQLAIAAGVLVLLLDTAGLLLAALALHTLS